MTDPSLNLFTLYLGRLDRVFSSSFFSLFSRYFGKPSVWLRLRVSSAKRPSNKKPILQGTFIRFYGNLVIFTISTK